MTTTSPSIAIVYDRVNTPYGGAENVLLALHQAFPEAPLYTSLYSQKTAPWAKVFPAIYSSFINRVPFLHTFHRWLAWLMPLAFEAFNFNQFDIVISVTSAEAKGILTQPRQLHLCYLLTPPRYLYQGQTQSFDSHWLLKLPLIRQFASRWLNYLRWWDQASIFRPDVVVPISQRVTDRIKQYYPAVKSSMVIYPPVEIAATQSNTQHPLQGQAYYLIISRLVNHKRLDLAIEACAQLNLNLVIVGDGPDLSRLRRIASSISTQAKVIFMKSADRQQLQALYTHCQAVLMPGEEDFGIVALEANSYGKPVIINRQSGAAELIRPGAHGIHIAEETVASVVSALQKFSHTSFSANKIRQNSLKYGTNNFIRNFTRATGAYWQAHQKQYDN